MGDYERKQIVLTDKLTEQKAELSAIKDDTQNIEYLIECFKKRVYIEELDRETIVELIDYIRVFKKKKVGKEYLQRVDIYFNFIGQVEGGGLSALQKRLSEDVHEKTDQTA